MFQGVCPLGTLLAQETLRAQNGALQSTSSSSDFNHHTKTLSQISDLRDKLQAGDVLFLDIDDTLLNHKKVLFWKEVQAIEPTIGKTIKSLQRKGVIVLCLTARSPHRAKKTQKQLHKIGIDLKDAIQLHKIPHLPFKDGVIYAPPPPGIDSVKGPVLKKFLDYFSMNAHEADTEVISKNYFAISRIKRIFFVDDKLYNIRSFLNTLRAAPNYQQIKFYGLHYQPLNELSPMNGKGDTSPSPLKLTRH